MRSCVVCKGVSKDFSYHYFPKDGETKRKWLEACNLQTHTLSKSSRICSRHFSRDSFIRGGSKLLKNGVFPTLNLNGELKYTRVLVNEQEIVNRKEEPDDNIAQHVKILPKTSIKNGQPGFDILNNVNILPGISIRIEKNSLDKPDREHAKLSEISIKQQSHEKLIYEKNKRIERLEEENRILQCRINYLEHQLRERHYHENMGLSEFIVNRTFLH